MLTGSLKNLKMDLINHRPNQWPKVEIDHVDWTTALHHCRMDNGQPSQMLAHIYRRPNPHPISTNQREPTLINGRIYRKPALKNGEFFNQ